MLCPFYARAFVMGSSTCWVQVVLPALVQLQSALLSNTLKLFD
ncbi:hypothetical protein PJE062_2418 [Pseudovibrio sp. JE062]|nr:hypothetical protein PJE062_2418 [Pseudovibrio sp. JE062]